MGVYNVEVRQGSGGWVSWLSGTHLERAEYAGTAGMTYTFRVQAVDRAGNASAWVESGVITVQAVTKYYDFNGQRVAMRSGSGTGPGTALTYLHTDQLGSVSLVTDRNGAVVSQTRYDPFGAVRWVSGPSMTDIAYTGQRADGFRLLDFHARYYSPGLHRFLSPDTLVPDPYNPLDWDRFAYVRNDPINNTDPTGHMVATDTRENGCSGSGPACIIDMYYAESGDTPGLHDSLEAYIDSHPGYDPAQDPELTGTAPFMVAAAQSRVGIENGSFWDYLAFGTMAGFGTWATGYAPYELRTGASNKPSQQQRDMYGDPDCAGCGYQLITDPALKQSAQNTLDLIDKGGPFPYKQDGTIYLNKGPGKLPTAGKGYYQEYTVPIPGEMNRGRVRYVVGGNGEVYLSLDHYKHFIRIR